MEDTTLIETRDGSHSVLSHRFGVTYHSKYGAIQESRHVFIEAGLFPIGIRQKDISIIELGFGSGLNALLTVVEARRLGINIHYETVEAYPLAPQQAQELNYPEQINLPESRAWLDAMHAAASGQAVEIAPGFLFRKVIGRFEDMAYRDEFDIAYFDAFAPDTQPELWTDEVLGRVYEALRPQGVLVTYSAKGSVKRTLKGLGFEVQSIPGPPGKREMTRAVKS